MTDADAQAYDRVLPMWAGKVSNIDRIALLSCNDRQEAALRDVFPDAQIVMFDRTKWDLNAGDRHSFDLVFAANVFMYSPDPLRWFRNVLASCRHFWMQDLCRGKRMDATELGDDGDSARFSFPSRNMVPRIDGFDVESQLGLSRIKEVEQYPSGTDSLHFLAWIEGDIDRQSYDIDKIDPVRKKRPGGKLIGQR